MKPAIAALLLIVSMIVGLSCSKTSIDCGCLPPVSVMGNWELTDYLADPGDGSGNWMSVSSANSKTIVFTEDFQVKGDFSIDMKSYTPASDTMLNIRFTSGETRIYRYRLNDNQTVLELAGPCIEACGSRFIRRK